MSSAVCANCGVEQNVDGVADCTGCGWLVFEPGPGPAVVVVHENRQMARQIGDVVTRAGFSVRPVVSGQRAIAELSDATALVVDVGLSGDLMAFQVIEAVRASENGADTPVVLVASVYNKSAYKRRPTALYGADDYVEQHHINDMLPSKLCTLLGIDPVGVAELESEKSLSSRHATPTSDLQQSIATTAYSIVADIALYHQSEFESAAAGGDASVLDGALEEGSRVLARMIGIDEAEARGPVRQAFSAFVTDMRGSGE